MPTKTWKSRERQVADAFGTNRTPLSGGNSGHTRSDTLHPDLFIEHKHRKKHSVVTLYDETAKLAKKEGKIPVVTLSEHRRSGFVVVVDIEHLQGLCKALESLWEIWNGEKKVVDTPENTEYNLYQEDRDEGENPIQA